MKNLLILLICFLTLGFVSCAADGDGDSSCKTCELSVIGGFGTVEEICDLEDGSLSIVTTTNGVSSTDTITGVLDTYVSNLETLQYDCN